MPGTPIPHLTHEPPQVRRVRLRVVMPDDARGPVPGADGFWADWEQRLGWLLVYAGLLVLLL